MMRLHGRINRDADSAAGGQGGGQAGAEGGQKQGGGEGSGGEGAITLTPAQLKQRLERAEQQARERAAREFSESGRLLSEEEAQARAEDRRRQAQEAEESARNKGRFKELYEKTQAELQAERQARQKAEADAKGQIEKQQIRFGLSEALAAQRLRPGVSVAQLRGWIEAEGALRVEGGHVVAVDQDGNQRYTQAGRPMGLEDFVAEWLGKNEIFLAPAGAGGPGGQTGANGVRLPPDWRNPEVYRTLSPDQKAEVRRQIGWQEADNTPIIPLRVAK